MANSIGPGATRALRRLAAGEKLIADGAGWRAGKLKVLDADVERLTRHDLVASDAAGYRISGPGMNYLARLVAPEAPNRLLQRTANVPRLREAAMRGARSANRAEEPLAWLHARGHVSDRQLAAGERLRRDWLLAARGPKVTMAWDAGPVARGRRGAPDAIDPTATQIGAKARFDAALASAGGGLSDILLRTVCGGEGLETAERAMGWPARAGKVVLCLGLDRVAAFYRV